MAKAAKAPRNYVSYFGLCQTIGGEIEEAGRGIAKAGIHAPVMYHSLVDDLERLKGFCERSLIAINAAQIAWDKAAGAPHA